MLFNQLPTQTNNIRKKKLKTKEVKLIHLVIFLVDRILPDTVVSNGNSCWKCGITILSKDDEDLLVFILLYSFFFFFLRLITTTLE